MKRKNRFCIGERWADLRSRLRNVTPEEAREVIGAPGLIILDVRSDIERQSSGIAGAVGMNYFDDAFIDKLLAMDRSRPYLVYCRTGRRSLRVCTWMQNSGFEEVYHLDGGLESWIEANR